MSICIIHEHSCWPTDDMAWYDTVVVAGREGAHQFLAPPRTDCHDVSQCVCFWTYLMQETKIAASSSIALTVFYSLKPTK